METALCYVKKQMGGIRRKNDAIIRKLFETAIKFYKPNEKEGWNTNLQYLSHGCILFNKRIYF